MHLLLVDDEASLLSLLGQHMTRHGHTVEMAGNVEEARALTGRSFDAAIIDWSLPDGNGLEVGRALLEQSPTMRVIFTSGYPLNEAVVPEAFRNRVKLLQKPFMPRVLLEVLKTFSL